MLDRLLSLTSTVPTLLADWLIIAAGDDVAGFDWGVEYNSG